jgi:choline dehydrogenase
MQQNFDVIIIGAGSAGIPLAVRLAEDKTRSVLLLDAGPRFIGVEGFPPELRYGAVMTAMMPGHPNNWGMVASLQTGVQQPNPRGRVVGGSSALNGTIFTRGLPEDFDGWAAQGNTAWSYEKVLPFFRKLETDHDMTGDYHGSAGPMPVRRAGPGEFVPVDNAFVASCREAGFPDDPDMNRPGSIGVGALPVNNIGGVRMNTAITYLDAGHVHANLTVRGGVFARRILLAGNKAIGVVVEAGGKTEQIFGGEIVLSAGAIRSPHLLMLSGVGPAEELRRVGIAVAHDLPLVGHEFTDHCSFKVPFRVSKRRSPVPDPTKSAWAHVGLHFTSAGTAEHSDMMFIQSSIPTNTSVLYGVPLAARVKMLRATMGSMSLPKLVDYVSNGWDHGITGIMQQDASRGEIRLASADAKDNPQINYHYLEDAADRSRLRDAIRLAARLIDSAPYRALGAKRGGPADSVLDSDALLDKFLIETSGTSMHLASSCRMGPSAETAVVDQKCRVHGIEHLRVVDTSIMPTVVRRCPAATAVLIGERAAEFFD